MYWAGLAIGIGALIIVTRAPLIFRPPETLAFYRGLLATDGHARAIGGFYLALGLARFGVAAETSGIPRQFLIFFAVFLLAMAVFAFAVPARFRATVDRIFLFVEESVDPALIRVLGIVGVAVGGLLVYLGVRAL